MKDFEFEFIAKKALEHFVNSYSWFGMGDLNRGNKYLDCAECLLELLEVRVCGSVGGFDKRKGEYQRDTQNPRYLGRGHVMDVFTRLLWILDHYTIIRDSDKLPYSGENTIGDLIKSLRKMYKEK